MFRTHAIERPGAHRRAGEAAGTWLCPSSADRARAVDMDARLKPMRRLALLVVGIALVLSAPSLGWWTLIPLGVATLGFHAADRMLEHCARPEYLLAAAWVLSQLAIAATVALGGLSDNPAVAWLAIPVVTLPARFRGRAIGLGVGFRALVMIVVTVGLDFDGVLDEPERVVMPLALLFAVALLSTALMRSDVEHRTVAAVDTLTGLLNRNALEVRAAELGQQSHVLGLPVAVIIGDLDRFKRVNDEHGRRAGRGRRRDDVVRSQRLRARGLLLRRGLRARRRRAVRGEVGRARRGAHPRFRARARAGRGVTH